MPISQRQSPRQRLFPALLLIAATQARADAPAKTPPASIPSETYTSPNQLVPLAGTNRRLNLFCTGTGAPTVMFESGLGSGAMTWRRVQAPIAAATRTCAYDRAGYGFSDPATRPSDAANAVDDLHALIQSAGIKTPVILVGHSIGGLYATLYTAEFPHDVAGLLLIDPAFAGQFTSMTARGTKTQRDQLFGMFRGLTTGMAACLDLARQGALAKPTKDQADACLPGDPNPDRPDATLLRELNREWVRPQTFAAVVSEAQSFYQTTDQPTADTKELEAIPTNFGDMPLAILTAKLQTFPHTTDAEMTNFTTAWKAGHDALARRSSIGTNLFVPDSGHYIQADQPAIVVAAITKIVGQVRQAHQQSR